MARPGPPLGGGPRSTRRSRLAEVTAPQLGIRIFQGIRCSRCKAGLHDSAGNPRWDVVGKLEFVCLGGCS